MKKILSIILLGFFFLQLNASPKFEVKHDFTKTEIVKQNQSVIVLNLNDSSNKIVFYENKYIINYLQKNTLNNIGIPVIPCWSSNLVFSQINVYKEKLNTGYLIDKKLLIKKAGIYHINSKC